MTGWSSSARRRTSRGIGSGFTPEGAGEFSRRSRNFRAMSCGDIFNDGKIAPFRARPSAE
jgi:hypothetical protein